jgi:hypothetical protein
MEKGGRTFTQFLEIISEPLLPFPLVPTPAIESPVFLPLPPKVIPTGPGAPDLVFQQFLEIFFGIFLFLRDFGLSYFAGPFSTVFVKGFASGGDRGEKDVSIVGDEERE